MNLQNKERINDARLTQDMEISRHGTVQMFRRDYGDRNFTDKHNADVILEHEKPEMYAEKIDGEWCWVNGCSKCEGSMNYGENHSYQVCEKHNVCVECGIHRKYLTETPWGVTNGFKCKPCGDIQDRERRHRAFEKLDGEEPCTDYTSEIVCPHCGSELSNDDIHEDQEMNCDVCEGDMKLTVNYTVDYSTALIGERITR